MNDERLNEFEVAGYEVVLSTMITCIKNKRGRTHCTDL